MPTSSTHTMATKPHLERVLAQLRAPLRELGLSMSLWDAHGRAAGRLSTCCEFCQAVGGSGNHCGGALRSAGNRACAEGKALAASAPLGCRVLAVPVRRRRRVEGTLVACFAPCGIAQGRDFGRLCDLLKLDRQALADAASSACRHETTHSQDLLAMLVLLVDREQSLQVAREEIATLSANLAGTYEELALLYTTSGSMKVTQSPREFLQNVCRELLEVMHVSAAAGVIYPHLDAPVEVALVGPAGLSAEQVAALAQTHVAPAFADSHQPVMRNFPPGGEVRALIAVPLVADERSLGMLIAFDKQGDEFDSTDIKLLSSIGNLTAVFLENSHLYADLEDLLMGVLHSLTSAIDAKDPYTCGHSQRVALVSKRLAEALGFPPARVQRVYLAGVLHDIGKIGVAEAALCKPGRLTDDEYASVKKHPEIGARILGSIRQLEDVVTAIVTHHERPDGRGYPRGLSDPHLPIEGQIVGLADCFDAMTSDRTYRKGMNIQEAGEEIRRCTGTQFGQEVAGVFLGMDLDQLTREMAQCTRDALVLGEAQERPHESDR